MLFFVPLFAKLSKYFSFLCPRRQIKEYNTEGELLREVELPSDILNPLHAVQLRSGEFVVCHGQLADAVHRVCTVSADSGQIVRSHGGQRGSDTGQYNGPITETV